MEYESIIGLEVHVQLNTSHKMFTLVPCGLCLTPNQLTNYTVLALPGSLPAVNMEAINMALAVGLAFGCKITNQCRWDRKHYFYPDLVKGYQISQYNEPICTEGRIEIESKKINTESSYKTIFLHHLHLEEDVGKLTHHRNISSIDYNRACVPLIEIVSNPDICNSDEAFAYLTSLRSVMIHLGVSNCDMERGQMRCDANISIRKKGFNGLGKKVELKNLNTISGIRNGIDYEINRQIYELRNGRKIKQETRHWNSVKNLSVASRSKELKYDYCYLLDPDLIPVDITPEHIENISNKLLEMPFEKQKRLNLDYNISLHLSHTLCNKYPLSLLFEQSVSIYSNPQSTANLLVNYFLCEIGNKNCGLRDVRIQPHHIANLAELVDRKIVSRQISKHIFIKIFKTGLSPDIIIKEESLMQSIDKSLIELLCLKVIEDNPRPVRQYLEGKKTAINALKGKVICIISKRASPVVIGQVLEKLLSTL